jgi:hypothetical protein
MTFKLTKKIIHAILIIAVIIIAAFLVYRFISPSVSRGVRIDNSLILIEEVRKISQLFTAVYFDEIAIDTFKYQEKDLMGRMWDGFIAPRPGFRRAEPNYNFRRVELVVVASGRIMAGYDLSLLKPEDMIIDGKTLTLTLPEPGILEIIINPSDYEIFIEEGRWSLDEAVDLKVRAGEIMQQRALERGILERSETTAIRILQNYFRALGFEEVTIKTGQADVYEPLRVSPSLE